MTTTQNITTWWNSKNITELKKLLHGVALPQVWATLNWHELPSDAQNAMAPEFYSETGKR